MLLFVNKYFKVTHKHKEKITHASELAQNNLKNQCSEENSSVGSLKKYKTHTIWSEMLQLAAINGRHILEFWNRLQWLKFPQKINLI